MPASPELALMPDLFELIETDVIDGMLAYNLSLSARPIEPVIVKITPEIRSPSCYGYEPKFALPRNEFEFTAETYDINQIVFITVNNLDT